MITITRMSAVLVCVLWFVAVAPAEVSVEIPDLTIPPGMVSTRVDIFISGGDSITDMVLYLQVGNGGTVTGNPNVPPVISFDLTGTIWESASGGFTTSSAFPPPDEMPDLNLNLNTQGETVTADGLLAAFTVDTSGMNVGDSVDLNLSTVFGDETIFQNGETLISATLKDGSITVLPEPACMMITAAMGVLLIRRKK